MILRLGCLALCILMTAGNAAARKKGARQQPKVKAGAAAQAGRETSPGGPTATPSESVEPAAPQAESGQEPSPGAGVTTTNETGSQTAPVTDVVSPPVVAAAQVAGEQPTPAPSEASAPPPPPPQPVPPPVAPPEQSRAGQEGPPAREGGWRLANLVVKPFLHLQFDTFGSAGAGVRDYQRADGTGLSPGMVISALRPGMVGSFADKLSFVIIPEFGPQNSSGFGQQFQFRGGFVIAAASYKFSDAFQLKFGQFAIPLTLTNQRPLMAFDFMSPPRTLQVVIPNRGMDTGIMLHGAPGQFVYGVGLFNGDGRERGPTDSLPDIVGRVAYRINPEGAYRASFGISGRYGVVDPKTSWRDAPSMFTAFGYGFWTSSYLTTSDPNVGPDGGSPVGRVRILASGAQKTIGPDLVVELGDFDLQAEAQFLSYGRREIYGSSEEEGQSLRAGVLEGVVYNATLGYWLTKPSVELKSVRWEPRNLDHKVKKGGGEAEFRPSVQLLVGWEQALLRYDSTARSPLHTPRGLLDWYTTRLRVDTAKISLSSWWSTRFRLLAEYTLFHFPGSNIADDPRRVDNQALAPGAVIPGERGTAVPAELPRGVTPTNNPTYYEPVAPGARYYMEFALRVQLWF